MQFTGNGKNGSTSVILGPDGRPWNRNGDTPPDSFPIPYAHLFAGKYQGPDRTFVHSRYDEAMRHVRQNAEIMWRDAWLMAMLNERKYAVESLPWHLEIPNEKDERQVAVRDAIRKVVEGIADLDRIISALLNAIWYGRYGVQVKWQWMHQGGQKILTIADWLPVNGDKIGHQHDHTPYVLVYGAERHKLHKADLILSTVAPAVSLRGSWRERFILHYHDREDADYFASEQAEGVHGVGIRSKIYWLDFLRRDFYDWTTTFFERMGLGLTLWYYPHGDAVAEAEVKRIAATQSGRTNLFVPMFPDGKGSQKGLVERIEVPVAGAGALREMIADIEKKIERHMVGQEASSRNAGSTGLGNSEGAAFQWETKGAITRRDSRFLAASLTQQLVYMIQKYSFPDTMPHLENGFSLRWVYDVEKKESDRKLAAVQSLVAMGLEVKADEARAAAGLSKPTEGDDLISPPAMGQPGMPGTTQPGQPPAGAAGQGPAEMPNADQDNNPLTAGQPDFLQSLQQPPQEQPAGDFLASLRQHARQEQPVRYVAGWINAGPAAGGKGFKWFLKDVHGRTIDEREQLALPWSVHGQKKPRMDMMGDPAAAQQPAQETQPADDVAKTVASLNKADLKPAVLAGLVEQFHGLDPQGAERLKQTLGVGPGPKSDLAKQIAAKAFPVE